MHLISLAHHGSILPSVWQKKLPINFTNDSMIIIIISAKFGEFMRHLLNAIFSKKASNFASEKVACINVDEIQYCQINVPNSCKWTFLIAKQLSSEGTYNYDVKHNLITAYPFLASISNPVKEMIQF
jgi:hypothetical protein